MVCFTSFLLFSIYQPYLSTPRLFPDAEGCGHRIARRMDSPETGRRPREGRVLGVVSPVGEGLDDNLYGRQGQGVRAGLGVYIQINMVR